MFGGLAGFKGLQAVVPNQVLDVYALEKIWCNTAAGKLAACPPYELAISGFVAVIASELFVLSDYELSVTGTLNPTP